MNSDGAAYPDPAVPPRPPSLVRTGCIVLIVLGAMSALLAGPSLLAPESVRCSLARNMVDRANTDGREWNVVDLGGRSVDDLSCEEAVSAAERIPRREGSPETSDVPGSATIRLRGSLAVAVGVGQATTAYLVLRTLRRRTRTVALVFASLGIVFPVLGIISVAILVFVAYAIGFSAAAGQVWPRPPRPGRNG